MAETIFHFKSSTDKTIFTRIWSCTKPKGVIQIVHGMMEHSNRYQHLANFFTTKGYIVVAHDHLGHGNTAKITNEFGYFHKNNGWKHLVKDIHILQKQIQKKYPTIPYFLLGHSMGSFIVRHYLTIYDDNIQGIILSGTGDKIFENKLDNLILKIHCNIKGYKSINPSIEKLAMQTFNLPYPSAKTNFDWLTRDETIVQSVIQDPLCNFHFTNKAYADLIYGINYISKQKNVNKTKNIPILLISGEKDPIGLLGKGVNVTYNKLLKAKLTDVTIKLYPNGRHEIFNEINKHDVYDYVINWLKDII